MEQAVLFSSPPYVVRKGAHPDPAILESVYEVYNTETNVIEDRQTILPNALTRARAYAAAVRQCMEYPVLDEWPVKENTE